MVTVTSFGDYRRILEQEAKAERRAAMEVGSTSFTDCLRYNKLEIEWASSETKKGMKKEVKVRGQDIGDGQLWQKFLRKTGKSDAHLISLVSDAVSLTQSFFDFLFTSHTERYRNLDLDGQAWLMKAVRLAVIYHLMDNKIDGYLRGEDTFADSRVAYYCVLVRTIKTAMAGAARLIQHIVKDEENAKKYLNEFFSTHYEQLRSIPFPQRDGILQIVALDDEGGPYE